MTRTAPVGVGDVDRRPSAPRSGRGPSTLRFSSSSRVRVVTRSGGLAQDAGSRERPCGRDRRWAGRRTPVPSRASHGRVARDLQRRCRRGGGVGSRRGRSPRAGPHGDRRIASSGPHVHSAPDGPSRRTRTSPGGISILRLTYDQPLVMKPSWAMWRRRSVAGRAAPTASTMS